MKRTTKINGVELDLRGISIDIERISPDDYKVTVGSDKSKFDSRLVEIIPVLKDVFHNVFKKEY